MIVKLFFTRTCWNTWELWNRCCFLLSFSSLSLLLMCLSRKTCFLIPQWNISNIRVIKEESTEGFLPGRASRDVNSRILTLIMHSFCFLLAWPQIHSFYTQKQHSQLIRFNLWSHFLSVNHFLYLLRKFTPNKQRVVCLFCHYTEFCALQSKIFCSNSTIFGWHQFMISEHWGFMSFFAVTVLLSWIVQIISVWTAQLKDVMTRAPPPPCHPSGRG